METVDDPVAVRADDELIEAIIHRREVSSSDPVESRLILLLTCWSTWDAGPARRDAEW